MNLPARLGLRRALSGALVVMGALAAAPLPAAATTIERIVSPSGIVAWLVREPSVPLIALDFAFKGGATQDPALFPPGLFISPQPNTLGRNVFGSHAA